MAPRRPVLAERIGRIVAFATFVLVAGAAGAARAQTAPGPKRMAYDPDRPVPAGYHVEHRTRYVLAISGALLFSVAYVPTAGAGLVDKRDGTPLYVIPILGPLLGIPHARAANTCQPHEADYCTDGWEDAVTIVLVGDAVVQAAGALMAWRGFAGRDILVRDEAPRPALLPGPIGGAGYGAWLTGRF